MTTNLTNDVDQPTQHQLITRFLNQRNCSDILQNQTVLIELLAYLLNKTKVEHPESVRDGQGALMYIIFVVVIFAAPMLIFLVRYLWKEREASKMAAFYSRMMKNKPTRMILYDYNGKKLKKPQITGVGSQHTPISGRRDSECQTLDPENPLPDTPCESPFPEQAPTIYLSESKLKRWLNAVCNGSEAPNFSFGCASTSAPASFMALSPTTTFDSVSLKSTTVTGILPCSVTPETPHSNVNMRLFNYVPNLRHEDSSTVSRYSNTEIKDFATGRLRPTLKSIAETSASVSTLDKVTVHALVEARAGLQDPQYHNVLGGKSKNPLTTEADRIEPIEIRTKETIMKMSQSSSDEVLPRKSHKVSNL